MTSNLKAHIFKGNKALGEENCKISYNGYPPKQSLLIFSLEVLGDGYRPQATSHLSLIILATKKSDINWRGELND